MPFFVFSLYILCICLLSGYRSQFFTWELNFWYEGTLALDKEIILFSILNFLFFLELCPFFCFSLYILCICLLSGYRSQFFTWKLNFWYEGTLALDEEIIYFSYLNFGFFSRVMSLFSF